MKNKYLFLFLFLTINSFLSFSQTNVSGGLFADTTWDSSGSPYIITSDVALFPGNTLTIEAGVTVKFNTNTKLILRGELNANGTENNKILFTTNNSTPNRGDWKGIEIENSQGGKIIASNIVGEYADKFISILNSSSGEIININDSEIKYCNFGILGYDGSFSHTIILNNLTAIDNLNGYRHAKNATITNSVFSKGEKGIMCWDINSNIKVINTEISYFNNYGTHLQGGAIIDNCLINNNKTGVFMLKDLVVKNSEIKFNENGIWTAQPNPYFGENIYDNIICDNTEYNFKHNYSFPVKLGKNCWCSNDENEISNTIFDGYDDVSLGIVTFTPFITDCSSTLSTENKLNSNHYKFHFYPNPASTEVIFSHESVKNIEIYSINGVIIKQEAVNKLLNIEDLKNGVYFIKIFDKTHKSSSFKKFIKI